MKQILQAVGWMLLGAFILMCITYEHPGRYQMESNGFVLDTRTGVVKHFAGKFGVPFEQY